MSEWIFCEEQMPPKDVDCLVTTIDGSLTIGSYSPPGEVFRNGFWECVDGGILSLDKVYAWIPLPTPAPARGVSND